MSMSPNETKLLQETHDAVIRMEGKVDDHAKTLYGNGRPGIVSRLQTVEQTQLTCLARKLAEDGHRSDIRVARKGNLIAVIACMAAIAAAAAAWLR